MIFSEILVLFLALVIAITLVLMLKNFFWKEIKIQIDKKVNSRELFEPVGSEILKEKFQDNDLEKLSENGT